MAKRRQSAGRSTPASAQRSKTAGPPKSKAAVTEYERPFPVVGIGASAGGLEAFTKLLQTVPADTGMAFVLIQHLDPKHESILASLLSRASKMPVHEVTNR